MSSNDRQPLSPAEARELGEQRESWCAVEMKKEQTWCRKQRKHDDGILQSTAFDFHRAENEPRCTFQVNAPVHRERKHYDQQCPVEAEPKSQVKSTSKSKLQDRSINIPWMQEILDDT